MSLCGTKVKQRWLVIFNVRSIVSRLGSHFALAVLKPVSAPGEGLPRDVQYLNGVEQQEFGPRSELFGRLSGVVQTGYVRQCPWRV